MRITQYLVPVALLGACTDPQHGDAPPSASSGSNPSDGSLGSGSAGETTTTTVIITDGGYVSFAAYRDGVNGAWVSPQQTPGGDFILQVHNEYVFVGVCETGGFEADTIEATEGDGGQDVPCGHGGSIIGVGGDDGTLEGTVVQPGNLSVGTQFSVTDQPANYAFQAPLSAPTVDLLAASTTGVALVRNITAPTNDDKNIGTIDIAKIGSPYGSYTATTSAIDSDETAATLYFYETPGGATLLDPNPPATASLTARAMPASMIGPLDFQEVTVAAFTPTFAAGGATYTVDQRSAVALAFGHDPLPSEFELLERLEPAWSTGSGGVVSDLRTIPAKVDRVELVSQNYLAGEVQQLTATPAFLAVAGTQLAFDVSAPFYEPSWIVPPTVDSNGETTDSTAQLIVSYVDPETGTHFSAESDLPLPGGTPTTTVSARSRARQRPDRPRR